MIHFLKIFFIIIIPIPLSTLQAHSTKVLKVAIHTPIPPYVFEDIKGIEIDIIKHISRKLGYSLKFHFSRPPKHLELLEKRSVDVAITSKELNANLYYSIPYISYYNQMYSLKDHPQNYKKLNDLNSSRVTAFYGAKDVLGFEYNNFVTKHVLYKENFHPSKSINELLNQRTDVFISDKYIFLWSINHFPIPISPNKFKVHKAFIQKTEFRYAFYDKMLREEFDKEIKKMKQQKLISKIVKKYIKNLSPREITEID